MPSPRVGALYRFPVKGFPGQEITSADVRRGSGIDGDRAIGLTNGLEPPQAGEWAHCLSFTALKSDTTLQQWHIDASNRGTAADITIIAPDGARAHVASDDDASLEAATPFLASRLTSRGTFERALVAADQGMFDSRHCGLSFINPATVAALGQSASVDIDPLRFRGNILLDGLEPYEEIGWVGAILRVGGARVWVRSIIERCSATRVNPVSAKADVNVPHLLGAHFGHLHCGVYGVVLDGGQVRQGDEITVEQGPQPGLPHGAPAGAYKTRTYPRTVTVCSVEERDGVVSVRLRDHLGWTREHFTPGQNIRVHPVIDAVPTWRTYTVVEVTPSGSADDIDLRIALDGVVSRHLAGLAPGTPLVISGPYGRVTPEVLGPQPVTITAGIGITPALALARTGSIGRAFHVTRAQFMNHLVEELRTRVELTQWSTSARGRPTVEDFAAWLRETECSSVVVCGPAGLGDAVRAAAELAGIKQVHEELFASPMLVPKAPELPEASIAIDGQQVKWAPGDGFILDALEEAGVDVSSNCRAGACGECRLSLVTGEVTYPVEPMASREDSVLVCCAYPAGDIELAR